MTTTDAVPQLQLEVHLDQDADGHVDATVPLRWCLTPGLLAEIQERANDNPLWVVVVDRPDPEGYNQQRWVTPLLDEMRYIRFRRPGNHRLTIFVVSGKEEYVKNYFLEMWTATQFNNNPFGWPEPNWLDEDVEPEPQDAVERDGYPPVNMRYGHGGIRSIGEQVDIDVDVPEELFAKPWPTWARNYLRLFFRHNPDDQCHQRRRMLFMGLFLPIVFTVSMVARLLAAVFSFLFTARFELAPLVRPFSTNVFDVLYDPPEADNWTLTFRKAPLTYVVVIGVIVSAWVFRDYWWAALMAVVCAAIGVGIGLLIVNGTKRFQAAQRAKETAAYELPVEELQAMVCAPGNGTGTVSVAALPKRKQTVRLHAAALKAKVCRPFPG